MKYFLQTLLKTTIRSPRNRAKFLAAGARVLDESKCPYKSVIKYFVETKFLLKKDRSTRSISIISICVNRSSFTWYAKTSRKRLIAIVVFDISKTSTDSHFGYLYDRKSLKIFNNYSPKAKWLPVNIHREKVEVNIHRNHWAWGE